MAEENVNAAPTEEYNDDGSKNPDYVAPKEEGTGAADTEENKGTDDESKGGEAGDDVFNDTIDTAKPPEIPTRKNVTAQNIIARKNNTIEKLRSKKEEEGSDDDDSGETHEDDSDDNSNLSPETAREISSQITKTLAPFLGKVASDAEQAELDSLVSAEPAAKGFLNHIRAYMSHDAYKSVPPVVIYHHLAFNQAQALGAKKKKAADLEAGQSRSGGRTAADNSSTDGLPSAEDVWNMSETDFAKMEEDALQGKFKK